MSSISVALCTYQGERFLSQQLASIAEQVRLPDELVVCDDRSSDETVSLIRRFAESSPFPVHLHVNDRNMGSTLNFDQAIGRCSGEFIALSDQDDVWHAEKLERLERAMSADAQAGYVFSDANLVDAELVPLGIKLWDTVGFRGESQNRFRSCNQVHELLNRTLVTGATMMLRSHLRPLISPIPAEAVHDVWIATLLSAVGAPGIFIDAALVDYRQHPQQQIGAQLDNTGWFPHQQFVNERRQLANLRLLWSQKLLGRLTEISEHPNSSTIEIDSLEVRCWLDDAVRHLLKRRAAHNAGALPDVAREWFNGNYRQYSGGPRAAIMDVLNCCVYQIE